MDSRAYSIVEFKSVDVEQRLIRGIATTPQPDSDRDIVEPLGAHFKNPLPLLLFHNQREPVGTLRLDPPTAAGITFEAHIPEIPEAGSLKDRVDTTWQSVKAGLMRGVSVGIRAMKDGIEKIPAGGIRWTDYNIFEVSLCVIPANSQATIQQIKSIDKPHLAVSGHSTPTALPVVTALKKDTPMTIPEQITQWSNTRAPKAARITELMSTSATSGATLDPAQTEEYDGLVSEVKSIDAQITRLREIESLNLATATPITQVTSPETASHVRGAMPVVQVKANVPKGTAFTRYIMAKIVGKNSVSDAIRYVESKQDWMDQTPEVLLALKASVNPGTILEPAWAAPLAVARPMQNEFLEMLRPETLIGKIPGLRNVPFNISMPIQTGGGTYAWVGEGAPKPVGNLQFQSLTLGVTKAAGILIISEELAKVSSPSAEATCRNDMIRGMAQYLDLQFIDPTVAAVANVSPASITNLANGYATAGTSGDNARTDLKKAITLMTQANYPISEIVFIMSEANAFALASALTTNGVLVNAGLNAKGGMVLGVPVVTSQAAGNVVAAVHAPSILFADDGGVSIDVSREASVEMSTTPTSPSTASVILLSLWQQNLIGLRAERFINWKRARTTAVVYTTATYV